MTLGRLYGGGAILIGDGEQDMARLARPLDPRLPRGGLSYLHAVSRWQLGVTETELNPLSPWVGEPKMYTLSSPGHPCRNCSDEGDVSRRWSAWSRLWCFATS